MRCGGLAKRGERRLAMCRLWGEYEVGQVGRDCDGNW